MTYPGVFSRQVIAAVKLYKELNVSGAWIDLDAHFGNNIEDSRYIVQSLNKAIPIGYLSVIDLYAEIYLHV